MLPHLRRPAVRPRFLGRAALLAAAVGTALGAWACDSMPLMAPTGTVINLYASSAVLPVNGSIEITAVAIEGGAATSTTSPGTGGTTGAAATAAQGTPVHNGTVITFTTTIGRIEPQEGKTHNGSVTVRLFSDGSSGVATVRAFSGGAASNELRVNVGSAAAARLDLYAEPTTLSAFGGTATLTARVFDINGNPLPGVPVTFTVETGGGSFSNPTALTDGTGIAKTTLTTNRETTVVATAGTGGGTGTGGTTSPLTAKVTLRINVASTLSITSSTPNPVENQPVTFTITPGGGATGTANIIRNTVVDFGDGNRIPLGNVSSATSVAHTYTTGGRLQAFQVTATGTDINGETASGTIVVVVNPQLPLAVTLTATPSTAQKGETEVLFSATVSGGSPIQYNWSFGDGNTRTTTGPTTRYTYQCSAPTGTVPVRVEVHATNAGTGFAETTVTLSALACP